MATAYQYDENGYFAGGIEAFDLLPNRATWEEPAITDGCIPRRVNNQWTQVENHKGQNGYVNGQPVTVTEYGPLPEGFSTKNAPTTLTEAQAAMRRTINAGFNAAMSASITMPSAGSTPSTYEVATALYDWRTDDPEGYAALLAIHTARRDALLAAVDAATTIEAVQAVAVSYAV